MELWFDEPINEYDVGETITLSSLFLTGRTIGQMEKGQAVVYVRDPSKLDLTVGAAIVILGAGYVSGSLRTTVVSSDGVGAITVAEAARSDVGQVLVGTPSNPTTVTCAVRQPDGSEVPCPPSEAELGVWEATFIPTLDGDHFYRFVGTGAATGRRWRKFFVRADQVPDEG